MKNTSIIMARSFGCNVEFVMLMIDYWFLENADQMVSTYWTGGI